MWMRYESWRHKFATNKSQQLTCAQLLWNIRSENSPVTLTFASSINRTLQMFQRASWCTSTNQCKIFFSQFSINKECIISMTGRYPPGLQLDQFWWSPINQICSKPTRASGSTKLVMFNYGAIIAEVQAPAMMAGFQTVLVMGPCISWMAFWQFLFSVTFDTRYH